MIDLKGMKNCIEQFLLDNGGHLNGYDTWVECTVCRYATYPLIWSTPNMGNLTIDEWKDKAYSLYEKLQTYIDEDTLVYIKRTPKQYGAYRTDIYYKISESLFK